MKKLALLVVIFVIALSACNKDKSKTDLLTSAPWKYVNPDEPCNADDIITFKDDNSFSQTAGSKKCDFDLGDLSGSWKFLSDETELEITLTVPLFGTVIDTAKIVALTETLLELEGEDGDPNTKFEHK